MFSASPHFRGGLVEAPEDACLLICVNTLIGHRVEKPEYRLLPWESLSGRITIIHKGEAGKADFSVVANEDVTLKITLKDSRGFEIQVKRENNIAIVEVTSTRKLKEMMKARKASLKVR